MGLGKRIFIIALVLSAALIGGLFYWLDSAPLPNAAVLAQKNAVALTHSAKDGIHRYVGEITLPHSCYTIKAEIRANPKDVTERIVTVASTDHLLDMKVCASIPTKYPVDVLTELDAAPKTVRLLVDGKEVQAVVREREWQSPRGNTVLDPNDNRPQ